MKTCQDIVWKSILIFLLCQYAVHAASQWAVQDEHLSKRMKEILHQPAMDTVYGEIKEMTLRLEATLNTMLRAREADIEMTQEAETLRKTKDALEHEKVLERTLNNLTAKEVEIQTIANELPTKMEERRADVGRFFAANIHWFQDWENAIRSQFLGRANKELDEDSEHSVYAAHQRPSHAKDINKITAEVEASVAAARQIGTEADTMRESLREYVKELETLKATLRERDADLTTSREEVVKIKHDLKAKEDQIQTTAKKLTQKAKECKAAFRHMEAAGTDLIELEDTNRMELLRRAQKELKVLKNNRKQKLKENHAEMKARLEANEAEMKARLEAKEAEIKEILEAKEAEIEAIKAILEARDAALESRLRRSLHPIKARKRRLQGCCIS